MDDSEAKSGEAEVVEIDKKSNENLPIGKCKLGKWAITGGPGRGKSLNKFTQQKQEFFKACKDGRLFAWVQEVLNSKDDSKKMEILRVWASLQPREVRAEFDSPQSLVTIVINRKEEKVTNIIDVKKIDEQKTKEDL